MIVIKTTEEFWNDDEILINRKFVVIGITETILK